MGFGRCIFNCYGRRRAGAAGHLAARAVALSAFLAGLCLFGGARQRGMRARSGIERPDRHLQRQHPGGFQAGGGVDSLTVNVLPGATVSDGGGGVIIGVNDFNTVTNSGTLTAGPNSTGIFAGVNNTIVNAASGVITLGDNSVAIFAAGNSTITNAGQITIGDAAGRGRHHCHQ